MKVLAGDVGATNARLALVTLAGGTPRVEERTEFASREHEGLAEIVSEYREQVRALPRRAAFGVAAPVREGRAAFANLDWTLEASDLSARTGLDQVRLVNDFEAVGHALPLLGRDDLVDLLDGQAEPRGTVAVLGAGTGLGHAFVTRSAQGDRVHSSEAGHVDFGPRTAAEDALTGWLRGRHGRVSCERVVSGPGLVDIYRFLTETGRGEVDPTTRQRLEREDPAAVVSERGLDASDPACRRALELFVQAYGAQAGNFALAVQATAGVYLGGGIAPKILPALRGEGFRRAFREKGKMAAMMREIPVRVITNPDAGLLGAARVAGS